MTTANTKRKRRPKRTMGVRMAAVGLQPDVRETMLALGLSRRLVDLTLENVVAGRELMAKSLREDDAPEHVIRGVVFDELPLFDNSRELQGATEFREFRDGLTRARVRTRRAVSRHIPPRAGAAGTYMLTEADPDNET